jgi:hypothetical protein
MVIFSKWQTMVQDRISLVDHLGWRHRTTLLANSEAALGAATLDGNYRLEPRYLTEFRTSSGLIVDFANSIIARAGLYAKPACIPAFQLSAAPILYQHRAAQAG